MRIALYSDPRALSHHFLLSAANAFIQHPHHCVCTGRQMGLVCGDSSILLNWLVNVVQGVGCQRGADVVRNFY